MTNVIFEILQKTDEVMSNKHYELPAKRQKIAAKEIAEMMKEFIEWTIKVEVFYGELTERYLAVTSDELDFKSFDELFNYWHENIYKK